MAEMREAANAIAWLRSPEAIRARCGAIFDAGVRGELPHFELRLERMDAVVDRVIRVTRASYPDLRVPYHSRWGHFRAGGVGLVVYCRKEGRALGEVTKFLVYNARKRQEGGDSASNYFHRTECVAGVQDMRFQELMPDVLHWLGVRRIHRLVSMSNLKYDAITGAGIEVGERIKIPDDLVPADARVEMDAKKAAGYFADGDVPDAERLATTKGRGL